MSFNQPHGIPSGKAPQNLPLCTVYFDGGCPLCKHEIAAYRQMHGAEVIHWVDASRCDASQLGAGLNRSHVLQRLHVQGANGAIFSGAAAFVEIWRRLPSFAWMARLCSSRYVLAVLDFAYGHFLVVRRLWRKP